MNVKPKKIKRSRGITPIPFVGSRERRMIREEITKPEIDNNRRGTS